jgi:hypothetical protein
MFKEPERRSLEHAERDEINGHNRKPNQDEKNRRTSTADEQHYYKDAQQALGWAAEEKRLWSC